MRFLTTVMGLALAAGSVAAMGAAQAPALQSYVGKHAFDPVERVTFLKHPAVAQVIETDAPSEWRSRVGDNGVSAKITEREGMVVHTACEPRNCSDRNWAIAIARDGTKGAVCIFDRSNPAANGWYGNGEKLIMVTGSCPNPREPAIAAKVITHVTGIDPWAGYPEG